MDKQAIVGFSLLILAVCTSSEASYGEPSLSTELSGERFRTVGTEWKDKFLSEIARHWHPSDFASDFIIVFRIDRQGTVQKIVATSKRDSEDTRVVTQALKNIQCPLPYSFRWYLSQNPERKNLTIDVGFRFNREVAQRCVALYEQQQKESTKIREAIDKD